MNDGFKPQVVVKDDLYLHTVNIQIKDTKNKQSKAFTIKNVPFISVYNKLVKLAREFEDD